MGRVFIVLILLALIGSAMSAYITQRNDTDLAFVSPPQDAAVPEETETIPGEFNSTGTLVFYPNNIGRPVPYIFYQDSNGRTAAKALTFSNGSPSDFTSWSGSRISVTGAIVQEHIIVSRITYLSGP